MDWTTAAPYFAAGAALVVGLVSAVISAIVSSKNARAAIEDSREKDRESRVWAKKADVYESLLRWLTSALKDPDRPEYELPPDLEAKATAYGTDAVLKAIARMQSIAWCVDFHSYGRFISLDGVDGAALRREVDSLPSNKLQPRVRELTQADQMLRALRHARFDVVDEIRRELDENYGRSVDWSKMALDQPTYMRFRNKKGGDLLHALAESLHDPQDESADTADTTSET